MDTPQTAIYVLQLHQLGRSFRDEADEIVALFTCEEDGISYLRQLFKDRLDEEEGKDTGELSKAHFIRDFRKYNTELNGDITAQYSMDFEPDGYFYKITCLALNQSTFS